MKANRKSNGFGKWEKGWRTGHAPRLCVHPDCEAPGDFRAPMDRDRLNDYYWFCLDHIRDYNSRWNYFEGWDADEIDKFQHDNAFWHRPTWHISGSHISGSRGNNGDTAEGRPHGWGVFNGRGNGNIRDAFGLFDDLAGHGRSFRETGNGDLKPLTTEDRQAFRALELDEAATPADIKAAYKRLVKACHPDMTGGDKRLEVRFRQIAAAYQHCMKMGFC